MQRGIRRALVKYLWNHNAWMETAAVKTRKRITGWPDDAGCAT